MSLFYKGHPLNSESITSNLPMVARLTCRQLLPLPTLQIWIPIEMENRDNQHGCIVNQTYAGWLQWGLRVCPFRNARRLARTMTGWSCTRSAQTRPKNGRGRRREKTRTPDSQVWGEFLLYSNLAIYLPVTVWHRANCSEYVIYGKQACPVNCELVGPNLLS